MAATGIANPILGPLNSPTVPSQQVSSIKPGGEVARLMGMMEELKRTKQAWVIKDMLDAAAREEGLPTAVLDEALLKHGVRFSRGPGGQVTGVQTSGTPGAATPAAPGSPGYGRQTPGTGGPSYAMPSTPGSSGRYSQGSSWGGGGGGGQSAPGFIPGGLPTGGTQTGGFSMTDRTGIPNNGPGPGALPGQGYTGGFSYGQPRSIFDGMSANPTYGEVISQVMRRQEDNRNAAMGIMGNSRSEIMNDPNRALLGQRTADLLSNPYSLDEATISRIMGQQNQALTQRAAQTSQGIRDREAARGTLRSGGATAALDTVRNRTADAMSEGERDIRVKAAIQNGQDLRSAMGAALPGISEKTNSLNQLDTTAARDILGGSSYSGDAFLTNALMGKPQGQQFAPMTDVNFGYKLG